MYLTSFFIKYKTNYFCLESKSEIDIVYNSGEARRKKREHDDP